MKENPDRKIYIHNKSLSVHLRNSLLHSGFFSHLLMSNIKLPLLHFVNIKSKTVKCTIIFIVLDVVLLLRVANWNVEGISLLQIHLKVWDFTSCVFWNRFTFLESLESQSKQPPAFICSNNLWFSDVFRGYRKRSVASTAATPLCFFSCNFQISY